MLIKPLKLIAYVRSNPGGASADVQLDLIRDYCVLHNYKIVAIYTDYDRPGIGLANALDSLLKVDGMITYDSLKLVEHADDSYRELRPLIENNFMKRGKKIIAIADAIENVTPMGQENLIELLNQWNRRGETPTATYDPSLHSMYSANQ